MRIVTGMSLKLYGGGIKPLHHPDNSLKASWVIVFMINETCHASTRIPCENMDCFLKPFLAKMVGKRHEIFHHLNAVTHGQTLVFVHDRGIHLILRIIKTGIFLHNTIGSLYINVRWQSELEKA